MQSLQLLMAVPDPGARQQLLAALEARREPTSVKQQDPGDWVAFGNALDRGPEILLLEMAACLDRFDETLQEAKRRAPRIKTVIVHPEADSESVLTAMRAGADEFIHAPFGETLGPALDRLSRLVDREPVQIHHGKVVALLSAKGGCGATSIACHVATDLHRLTGQPVVLADFDLVSGMVGFLMRTDKPYSVLDAVDNLSRLDDSLWKALTMDARPGLTVLPAPQLFSPDQSPQRDQLKALLGFMRSRYAWIVLDLGRSLNSIVSNIYDELDQVLLVSVLEAAALHGVKTVLRRLAECGQDLTRVQLVINRAPKMLEMPLDELAKTLGRPVYATILNDYQGIQNSYSTGNLLASGTKLGQQYTDLAVKVAKLPAAKPQKRFSFFG
jgi:pilus assembly protein CpaE